MTSRRSASPRNVSRDPSRAPQRPREEPRAEKRAEPAAAPERAAAILKSGVIDGMAYTLYADGSIEAELPQGTVRFASVDALRAHWRKALTHCAHARQCKRRLPAQPAFCFSAIAQSAFGTKVSAVPFMQ